MHRQGHVDDHGQSGARAGRDHEGFQQRLIPDAAVDLERILDLDGREYDGDRSGGKQYLSEVIGRVGPRDTAHVVDFHDTLREIESGYIGPDRGMHSADERAAGRYLVAARRRA